MKITFLSVITLIVFLAGTVNLEAQRNNRGSSNSTRETRSSSSGNEERQGNTRAQQSNSSKDDRQNQQPIIVKRNKEAKHYPQKDAVVVTHRPDRTFTNIHNDHQKINYHGVDYSYSQGHYYRQNNNDYVLIAPPRGIRVNFIPEGFLTIMVQNIPYFYFEGVYYTNTADKNYEVVNPPMGAIVPELPEYDVKALVINGKTVFEYDNILYKPVVTETGVQYKVIGTLGE